MSRDREINSIRQIDPAFVTAITDYIGGFVDQFRNVVENPAISLRVVIIDERLPSDHLDPPLSPEKLTRDAAFLLKINEFEHNSNLPNIIFHLSYHLKTMLSIRTSEPGYLAAI